LAVRRRHVASALAAHYCRDSFVANLSLSSVSCVITKQRLYEAPTGGLRLSSFVSMHFVSMLTPLTAWRGPATRYVAKLHCHDVCYTPRLRRRTASVFVAETLSLAVRLFSWRCSQRTAVERAGPGRSTPRWSSADSRQPRGVCGEHSSVTRWTGGSTDSHGRHQRRLHPQTLPGSSCVATRHVSSTGLTRFLT
jgi:hypothetical protein